MQPVDAQSVDTKPVDAESVALTQALKEWAVAIEALAQGETILLLRKGGIRDQGGKFRVAESKFWLYPTYEHQKPNLLKPSYADRVQVVPSGWHPETIEIAAWAEVSHCRQISEAAQVEALLPFHVWNETFVAERLKWQPRSPLTLLFLRVYRLPQPQTIAFSPGYGGCKSWIELPLPNAIADRSLPALSDIDYTDRVQAIEQHLANP